MQASLEQQYSRKGIHRVVLDNVSTDFEIGYKIAMLVPKIHQWIKEEHYESKKIRLNQLLRDEDLLYILNDIMVVAVEEQYTTIQTICGKVSCQMKMDTWDAVKCVAELVTFLAEADLLDMIPAADSDTGGIMIQSLYDIDEDTREWILQTQYLPPMIEPPAEVRVNYDYSYHTEKSWMILGKGNNHNKPLGLDVINIMNQIELELDEHVLATEEKPNKPLDTIEKQQQFEALRKSSRNVYNLLLDHGNKFYLTWKYDKRGRIYSQGYHVNIQSTEYKKALINLKNKEVISL